MSGIAALSSWLAIGSLAAAGGTFALVAYLRRHLGKPGAGWLVATLVAQGLFCLLAGVSLAVSEPGARLGMESLTWAALAWVGPLFLAFALEYTGRSGLLDGWTMVPVAALTSLVVATAPINDVVLRAFRVESTGPAVTVSYALEPWGLFAFALGTGTAGVAVALLVDTVLSYGPLYRREAATVALSAVTPTIGVAMWAFGLGPDPSLAFVAVLFVPHVLLDAYAFVGSGMFETNPTTRRAADRTAIDDIGTPVLVLDPDARVVDYNDAADPLLDDGSDGPTLLGTSVSSLVDIDADPVADGGVGTDGADPSAPTGSEPGEADELVTVRSDGRRREFLVSRSTLSDPKGASVGTTLVFQDVTRERRREQRLDVLNRVLRHNLRNKMTAVAGNAELIADRSDDERLSDIADIIDSSARELIDIGEKARTFEQCRRDGPRYRSVDLETVLTGAVADYRDGAARIDVTADGDAAPATDPELLRIVVANLVENAVEHVEDATVSVTATVDGGELRVAVADDGPGIPDGELAPLDAGAETQLEHATGIGLWVVQWSIDSLGGTVSFDTDDGTVVTVRLPDGPGGFDGGVPDPAPAAIDT
ncbi:HTR-like protein [Halosimplex carlsbadense 2-9-1]|uniref:histidine kinase n=1 Tax=Halosimplex carlsbadense 2-9-1 TaxID=797114 RepID=M0D2J3_9EURY|nr:histidine kinase N-terminal 7TM domain-containing protein [Halosimplex carlsbadense]ELZ28912.1 HTR-like protein [Halosimplex carlsbadense 2-9-1]